MSVKSREAAPGLNTCESSILDKRVPTEASLSATGRGGNHAGPKNTGNVTWRSIIRHICPNWSNRRRPTIKTRQHVKFLLKIAGLTAMVFMMVQYRTVLVISERGRLLTINFRDAVKIYNSISQHLTISIPLWYAKHDLYKCDTINYFSGIAITVIFDNR